MCVCVCVCVCVYVCVYMLILNGILVLSGIIFRLNFWFGNYIYIYIYIARSACLHACICTYSQLGMHICMHISIFVRATRKALSSTKKEVYYFIVYCVGLEKIEKWYVKFIKQREECMEKHVRSITPYHSFLERVENSPATLLMQMCVCVCVCDSCHLKFEDGHNMT